MKKDTTESIQIKKHFDAPVQSVWKAWTDPVLILKWFGSDPKGSGLRANLTVNPGGCFEISFQNADGTVHTCRGVYDEVINFSKLKFSWEWESEPGVVSLVSVSFIHEQGSTEMEFIHSGMGNKSIHDYQKGWQSTFLKLEQVLTEENG